MQNGFFVLLSSRVKPVSPALGVCSIEWLADRLLQNNIVLSAWSLML